MNIKEYNKQYQKDNKEAIKLQRRLYREQNKEKIKAQKQSYYSRPEARKRKAERNKELYLLNREKVLVRQCLRRRERRDFMDKVCMMYRCQNPDCKWQGEFHPCQLTFHHLDPKKKITEVAKMESWSFPKIVAEISKCVVLCRNCHPIADKGRLSLNEGMLCNILDNLDLFYEVAPYFEGLR